MNQNDNSIEVPEDVLLSLESIAKAVHEEWSRQRVEQGWIYGEYRNELKKETPCLVPYDELPEIEKDYDRNTSICVIKSLLQQGFEITKK